MVKGLYKGMQWLARLSCVLALLSLGFAHQVPAFADSPAQAQYQLPDGTFPVICVTYQDEDGKEHGKVHPSGCETCQISAVALLPAPSDIQIGRVAFVRSDTAAPKRKIFHRPLYPPNSGPRAPPMPQSHLI